MKKKITLFMSAILVVILSIIIFVGCTRIYGYDYKSMEDLKQALESEQVFLMYPTLDTPTNKDHKQNFVSVIDQESKKTVGYKVYSFNTPFNTAVYGYNYTKEGVICDDINRLTPKGEIRTSYGTAKLYSGEGHDNSLFLIGAIDIDGYRYEVRVIGNNEQKDGKFINFIYEDNEMYDKAISKMIQLFDSLK